MKFIRKLFGKQENDDNATAPQVVVESLSSEQRNEFVLAKNDGELDAKIEALASMSYVPVLKTLVLSSEDYSPKLVQAARQRIAELIDEKSLDHQDVVGDFGSDLASALGVISLCTHDDVQQSVLAGIDEENLLAELCAASQSAKVRKTLAERISSPSALKSLVKLLKHKDKTAYKIVKAKLDLVREEESIEQAAALRISSLCEDVEAHAKRGIEKDYVLKLDSIKRRWSELNKASISVEQQGRFDEALSLCENKLEESQKEERAAAELQTKYSEVNTHREQLIDTIWQLLNRLYSFEMLDGRAMTEAKNHLAEYKASWLELKNYGQAKNIDAKNYTLLCDAVELVLAEYDSKGTLVECRNRVFSAQPESETLADDIAYLRQLLSPLSKFSAFQVCDSVAQAQAILARIQDKQKEQESEKHKLLKTIGGLVRKANGAIDQGRLKQAIGIRHSIDEKKAALEKVPNNIVSQLESLDEAIQKLIDWQAYAVVPKKKALIEKMEALVGVDLPPEALATKIKHLQDEWKELAQSGNDRQEELWVQFSNFADSAYEPCKAHFEKLSEHRQHNLSLRQGIVDQLRDYDQQNDWENADWKMVEKVLRSARQELYACSPVDRAANKPVQAEFDRLMSKLQGRLEAEFNKNKEDKERIIAEAEKLGEMADLEQAIDSAKRLQAQWKLVGRCAYKDDERLWKAFRGRCDVVFEKKDSIRKEQDAQLDQNAKSAQALIDELNGLCLVGEQVLSSRQERDRIVTAFGEVGELPRKYHSAIRRDFSLASEKYEQALRDAVKQREADSWKNLFDVVAGVNRYYWETSAVTTADDETSEEGDIGSLQDQFNAVAKWPEGTQSLVSAKLDGEPVISASREEAQKKLALLCIKAEIAAGAESPEVDKHIRMEYQVSQLQQGLGSTSRTNAASRDSLVKEWVSLDIVPDDLYQSYFERFFSQWSSL